MSALTRSFRFVSQAFVRFTISLIAAFYLKTDYNTKNILSFFKNLILFLDFCDIIPHYKNFHE